MTPEYVRSSLPSLGAWSVGLWLYPGPTETWTIARAPLERTHTVDAFISTPGLWLNKCAGLRTNEERDLSSSKAGKYCGHHGDLHRSCWFILSWPEVICSQSLENEIVCEAKIWFHWVQTQISTKENETPVPVWPDPLSDYHCFHPGYIQESLNFCLQVGDYEFLLRIASFGCHFVLCHFWLPTLMFKCLNITNFPLYISAWNDMHVCNRNVICAHSLNVPILHSLCNSVLMIKQ